MDTSTTTGRPETATPNAPNLETSSREKPEVIETNSSGGTSSTMSSAPERRTRSTQHTPTRLPCTPKRKPDPASPIENLNIKKKRTRSQRPEAQSQSEPEKLHGGNEDTGENEKRTRDFERQKILIEQGQTLGEQQKKLAEQYTILFDEQSRNLIEQRNIAEGERGSGDQSESLKQQIKDLEAAKVKYEQDAQKHAELRKKHKALSSVCMEKHKELKLVNKEKTQLEEKNQDLKRENEKCSMLLKEVREKNQGLLKEKEKFTMLNLDLREAIDEYGNKLLDKEQTYEKILDTTIIGHWENLDFFIKQLAARYLSGPHAVDDAILNEGNEYAKGILTLAQETRNTSSSYRIFRFKGYIWRRLYRDIFSGQQVTWAGPHAITASLAAFCQELEAKGFADPQAAEVMSSIKSGNAHQIDAYFGTDETLLEEYVDSVVQDLSVFEPEEVETGSFRQSFSEIVRLADTLRVTIMKSKALFKIKWPPLKGRKGESIPRDEVYVCYAEWTTEKTEREVLHVASPHLLKCGQAEGRGFEHHTTLAKASIILAEPKTAEQMRELDACELQGPDPGSPGPGSETQAGEDHKQEEMHAAGAFIKGEDDEDDTESLSSTESRVSSWAPEGLK